jgi:fucose permease
MPTPLFLLLFLLFVCAAGIVLINLTGDPGIDYWDLDGDKKTPVSRLDVLRSKPIFYGAGAVLIGAFIAYLALRQ